MIIGFVAAGLVLLVGWIARPRPPARAARERRRLPLWSWTIPAAGLVLLTPIVGVLAVAVAPIAAHGARIRRSARSRRQTATDYPDALDLLVLSIRAGYLPAQAIDEIAPFLPSSVRPAFAAVGTAMSTGARFADALQELQPRLGSSAQPLIDSLASADRYGLPLAPVLERLAFEARQQRRRDADASARELPVRLAVPLVLCTLPSFVLLAIVPLLLGALSSLHT